MTNSVISKIKEDPKLKESTQALVKDALSDAEKLMNAHRDGWRKWATEGPKQIKDTLLEAVGNKDKVFLDVIDKLEASYVFHHIHSKES